jgi:hypothetical protein
MSSLKNFFILYLISSSINISFAQSNNSEELTESKIAEYLKHITIEEDQYSGIKDIYIGSKVIEENGKYFLKEVLGTICELSKNYNAENSPYAKEFKLSQSTFKLFRNKVNYLVCNRVIFNQENNITLTILKSPKFKNQYTVIMVGADVTDVDRDTLNYGMEIKWGKSKSEITNNPNSNNEICLQMTPYEKKGDNQLNKCTKELGKYFSQINEAILTFNNSSRHSNALLYENKDNFARLFHTPTHSKFIIESKKAELIIINLSEIFQSYENEIKLNQQKNISKDF